MWTTESVVNATIGRLDAISAQIQVSWSTPQIATTSASSTRGPSTRARGPFSLIRAPIPAPSSPIRAWIASGSAGGPAPSRERQRSPSSTPSSTRFSVWRIRITTWESAAMCGDVRIFGDNSWNAAIAPSVSPAR